MYLLLVFLTEDTEEGPWTCNTLDFGKNVTKKGEVKINLLFLYVKRPTYVTIKVLQTKNGGPVCRNRVMPTE